MSGAVAAPWPWLGVAVALGPAMWMWDFTVDDALIPVRYAHHLVSGVGWRFNSHGPTTDGVTPLPWPLILAPLARGDALVALARAKVLGAAAWGFSGAILGDAVGRVHASPVWVRVVCLAVLGLSVPPAAYAVSGMETTVATLLATLAAVTIRRPIAVALTAGFAATLRPELAVWGAALALGASLVARSSPAKTLAAVSCALAPFAAVALIRTSVWGRPAPLALLAKPSDIAHGLAYGGAACVVTLTPLLVLAPIALRRTPHALALTVAAAAHVLAIVAVGGDWMPYARLMVPVVPSLVLAAVLASPAAHSLSNALRLAAATGLGAFLVARGGTEGRRVGADREALVDTARRAFEGVMRPAALDVGWVGAATDADVIDLAGLTDPEIAALPGGHTSKRVDAMFLLARRPDALLLYAPTGLPRGDASRWEEATYPRAVEARLARDPLLTRLVVSADWLPLGGRGAGYVLLRLTR